MSTEWTTKITFRRAPNEVRFDETNHMIASGETQALRLVQQEDHACLQKMQCGSTRLLL